MLMKRLFAAVLTAFILIALAGCGQQYTVGQNTVKQKSEPQKTVQQTLYDSASKRAASSVGQFFDENKDYTSKMVDYPHHSANGGMIEYYCKNNEIKRMTMRVFGERGQAFYDFYMFDGGDCYAIITDTAYKDTIFDDSTIKKEIMKEYYIIGDEVMVYSADKNDLIKYQNDNDYDVLSAFKDAKAEFTA